jgi:hypothetical protein
VGCCQCQGIEELFGQQYVAKDLTRYRTKGPDKMTRMQEKGFINIADTKCYAAVFGAIPLLSAQKNELKFRIPCKNLSVRNLRS